MESRTKRNLVTRNAFHTCLCFPPPVGNEQNQEGKPCQERNKAKYASLMPHSRRFPEQECTKWVSVPRAQLEPMTWQAPPAPTQFTQGCSATQSALPLRTHRMSCSAMNLRLSCPPPLGSSAHTSSSTMSMFAWVGSLNSTMPRLHHQMSQIMPDFSRTPGGESTYGCSIPLCKKVNFRCIATTMRAEICGAGRYFWVMAGAKYHFQALISCRAALVVS